MNRIIGLIFVVLSLTSTFTNAENLPKVTGLELTGDQLSWDVQEGATGYNIHRNYEYFDTVRGKQSYTVSEPGNYHVISFNDSGMFGVTRTPEEGGQPYTFVVYTTSEPSIPTDPTTLPKVTGLELNGNQLSWDAQEGATGYNIHRDYEYFDTVRGTHSYTVSEPGGYHVISFNDNGMFGVTRTPEEGGQPYTFVEYTGCAEGLITNNCLPSLSISDPAYFKEVALNSEFGSSGNGRIRKWRKDINYFVTGELSAELSAELDRVVAEINELIDVRLQEVDDASQGDFEIFFGSGVDYANNIEPNAQDQISSNNGLVWIFWNSSYEITSGSMYVDIFRADTLQYQSHILREELTQSLGLLNDSYEYSDSIFYQNFSLVTEYAPIDREVIQTLYSPSVTAGMTEIEVDQILGIN